MTPAAALAELARFDAARLPPGHVLRPGIRIPDPERFLGLLQENLGPLSSDLLRAQALRDALALFASFPPAAAAPGPAPSLFPDG